jgi:signal transduction histidine kinase
MRKLSIRQWMVVGMLAVLIVRGLFYQLADAVDRRLEQPFTQQQNAILASALDEIASGSLRWRDREWQDALRTELDGRGIHVLVLDPSGREIFHTGVPRPHKLPDLQAAVVEQGRRLGTVQVYGPERGNGAAVVTAILATVLTLLFVGWQMGRYVVKPLEAMSLAARRIADGHLDFDLPESRAKEVDEVRRAFRAMGDGLRESIRRQAEMEEERRFFIGAIAHDLRTPLFALRGYLRRLEEGRAASLEQQRQYVAVCRQKADQLDRLVSDLFAYTKAEFLEQTRKRERVSFHSLLEKVTDSVRPQAQAKGVDLLLQGPDQGCLLEGDPHLLERAVQNLLDNALRHTPTGGRIAVRWRTDNGRVSFVVEDTGPGIAAHDLPHVFDPLYRGETSRNADTGGAGLGLAIARRILRAHGGDLAAANREGGGAAFSGWLAIRGNGEEF